MASTEIFFVIAVLFIMFLLLTDFIFSEAVADTTSTYTNAINCQYPDFNGLSNSTLTESCSNVDAHDFSSDAYVLWNVDGAWYTGGANWNASIPTGWYTYTGAVLTLTFEKVAAVFALIAIPLVAPAVISGLWFIWPILLLGYLSVGITTYKVISPFV